MARLFVHLEEDPAQLSEAQAAARILLAHPLVTDVYPDRGALPLVRQHEEPVREEMARLFGYRLELGRSWARLVRRPSRLSAARPAATRSGRRFGRRSYATLCLVLAALEEIPGQSTLVSGLVDEVNRQAAGETLLAVDATHHEHRKALVDAVLFLQDRGVLTLVEGDAETWQRDGQTDALFHFDLDAAARVLIAWPSVLGVSDDPAALLVEHHAPTQEGEAEAVRHRLHRRLIEQVVVRYDELDDEELTYSRQRRGRFSEQLSRLTGCTVEARAEGFALIDRADRPLGEHRFPAGGTIAWAALLLGERLVEAVANGDGSDRAVDPERLVTAWAGLVDEYGAKFAKEWRADTDGLLRRSLQLLADHELVDLAGHDLAGGDRTGSGSPKAGLDGEVDENDTGGAVVIRASLARYRAEVRQREVREVQEALL